MDDYINREAAKQALGEAHFENYGNAIMVIMELPAADVKPIVRGKWLLKDRDGSWACWTCSECGRLVHLTDYKENVQEEYPFCHCGADMRGIK